MTEKSVYFLRFFNFMILLLKRTKVGVIADVFTCWKALSYLVAFGLQIIDEVVNVKSCLNAMSFFLFLPDTLVHGLISIFIWNSKAFNVLALHFNIELPWSLIYSHMQDNIVIFELTLFGLILLYQSIDFAINLCQSFVTMLNRYSDHIILKESNSFNRIFFQKLCNCFG